MVPFAPKTCLRGTGIEDGKQACLFNMSRTLSISNNGPRAMNSPLALSIFSGVFLFLRTRFDAHMTQATSRDKSFPTRIFHAELTGAKGGRGSSVPAARPLPFPIRPLVDRLPPCCPQAIACADTWGRERHVLHPHVPGGRDEPERLILMPFCGVMRASYLLCCSALRLLVWVDSVNIQIL